MISKKTALFLLIIIIILSIALFATGLRCARQGEVLAETTLLTDSLFYELESQRATFVRQLKYVRFLVQEDVQRKIIIEEIDFFHTVVGATYEGASNKSRDRQEVQAQLAGCCTDSL